MKLQLILITALALTFGACGKKTNAGSTRVNRSSAAGIVSGTTSCNPAIASSWGRIYDNNIDGETFRQKVADLSFRSLDEIGTISPLYNSNTGIEFQMTLTFSNGSLVQNATKATIKISDSFTVQENAGYIQFVLAGMEGQGSAGNFNAKIGDSKGYVRLQGYKTTSQGQQILYGQAYYNNNAGENYLGEFVIAACAAVGI